MNIISEHTDTHLDFHDVHLLLEWLTAFQVFEQEEREFLGPCNPGKHRGSRRECDRSSAPALELVCPQGCPPARTVQPGPQPRLVGSHRGIRLVLRALQTGGRGAGLARRGASPVGAWASMAFAQRGSPWSRRRDQQEATGREARQEGGGREGPRARSCQVLS